MADDPGSERSALTHSFENQARTPESAGELHHDSNRVEKIMSLFIYLQPGESLPQQLKEGGVYRARLRALAVMNVQG